MSRIRWSDAAAVALTIAVIAGIGFVSRAQHTPTSSAAATTVTERTQHPPGKLPSILFIGDSYTAGEGVPEMSYGCLAASRTGFLCNLATGPGTGYISGGSANRFVVNQYIGPSTSFDERLPGLAAKYNPDIVVLDGGRNDIFAPPNAIFAAMSATITEVRRTWPQAQIVFIRPRFLSRPDDDLGFDDNFMADLEAIPAAEHMIVIDPIESFASSDTSALLGEDGIHPNEKGEQALSAALVDSLRQQGIGPQP